MRVLVCPDSFKGTFSAVEVAAALGAGIEEAGGAVDLCPAADGGEGTAETVRAAIGGEVRSAAAHDPLGRSIEASFVVVEDGATAVIDTAAASGLPLIAAEERDAEAASTYGTGELIAAAVGGGARRVLLAAGGSATTDGGVGAIEALRGSHISALVVLCDVTTRFEDAAKVFGPQKGADPAGAERLTARLDEIAEQLPRDPRGLPMTGCAGGLSGGLWAGLGAELRPGAEFVLDLLGFEERLARADVVVSGEGRIDSQSLEGKIVGQIAARCAAAGKPLHVVVGQSALDPAAAAAADIASITEAGDLAALRIAGRHLATSR